MDFSKLDDAAQWQKFRAEVEGLDIGVLGTYMPLPIKPELSAACAGGNCAGVESDG